MANQPFPFIRTRSMTQRLESLSQTSPPKPAGQGLVPPTATTRIPLSEALLNLERDGSPRKSTSLSSIAHNSFDIAPFKLDGLAHPPPKAAETSQDKENPFLVTSTGVCPSLDSPKKRKAPLEGSNPFSLDDSPKRPKLQAFPEFRFERVDGADDVGVARLDEGLGTVQRKIEFLSLKRARDSSPPPPDPPSLKVPDPDIDDTSPRKRVRPTFLGSTAAPSSTSTKPELPEMPYIDLLRPPPSPTRAREPPSPTKFIGVPQLEKSTISRSLGSGSLFTMSLDNAKMVDKGKEAPQTKPAFLSKFQPALPDIPVMVAPPALSSSLVPKTEPVIDPALLNPSPLSASDGQTARASSPSAFASTPSALPHGLSEVAASSPPPTPLRALSPPGRLPSSRLPVRSTRLRGQTSLASLAQAPPPAAQPQPVIDQPRPANPPMRHSMQTRAAAVTRPIRATRKQQPPSAFRAPPKSIPPAPIEDILAPIKDDDHVPRDVGTVGPAARPSLTSLSSEAQTSLSNLSTALSKLSLPPPRSNSRMSFASSGTVGAKPAAAPPSQPRVVNSGKGHSRKPSQSSKVPSLPNSKRTSTLAVLANPAGNIASGSSAPLTGASSGSPAPLLGCVVFVDVRTKDGDDAGGLFIDMLKTLGARVLKSPTASLTHLVLKSPLLHTITRYHNLPDPKPEVVAVGWVVKCAEEKCRVDVADWRLDLSAGAGVVSAIPGCSVRPGSRQSMGKGPRRMSMEPRRIELLDEASLSHVAAPMLGLEEKVERAKRRSLMYQPKFSSPLRTNAYVPNKGEDEDMEDGQLRF